jgi:hypothetical protein
MKEILWDAFVAKSIPGSIEKINNSNNRSVISAFYTIGVNSISVKYSWRQTILLDCLQKPRTMNGIFNTDKRHFGKDIQIGDEEICEIVGFTFFSSPCRKWLRLARHLRKEVVVFCGIPWDALNPSNPAILVVVLQAVESPVVNHGEQEEL